MAVDWAERGLLPDAIIRRGIRGLLRQRLGELPSGDCEAAAAALGRFIAMMDAAQIAPMPAKANEQHYELPADFFALVLGARRKYSCCYWPEGVMLLDEAEAAALKITCERAELADGMDILELGCGWGALALWIAEHYPNSRITAVSNSHSQRRYIEAAAARRTFNNVRSITCDMNDFDSERTYDRVISVEMFEHMRNYRWLFGSIHRWLKPGGRFFMHIFCHRTLPYEFLDQGPSDWVSRHFFTGGMMPSDDLPLYFQDRLKLLQRWRWSGQHYEKTLNAWLVELDRHKISLGPILGATYGEASASRWWMRWRIFFMACAELFGYDRGQQWWVSHYLFERLGGIPSA